MADYEKIEVNVYSDLTEEKHWHIEPEFIYVVEGAGKVWVEGKEYKLLQNDMILVNSRKNHFLRTKQGSMVCKILFPYQVICHLQKEDFIYFRCNSTIEQGYRYEKLREYVKELLMAYIGEEERIFLLFSAECKVLDYLLMNFRVDTGKQSGSMGDMRDQRISKILNYIYANYRDTVSLTEIAEKMYMTPSSLSRFFKKETGEAFVQYVRKIRLQKAADELISTQTPVSRIAVDQGFSTPSAMNKDFRENFGITPTEFRELYGSRATEGKNDKVRASLSRIICKNENNAEGAEPRKRYQINTRNQTEYRRWRNHILNVGPAYTLDTANMRSQLLVLKEKLDFEYIRIWGVFSKRMMIYEDKNRGQANFNKIDDILDFCVANNFKVFFDLGMRSNKAMASEMKVLYNKEEGIRFHCQEEWEDLLERFIKHIVKRYGKRITEQWIFEFTFFLNERPYYESDHYSTKTVWNRGYQIVKQNIENAMIAGPGLLVMPNEFLMGQIVKDFLSNENVPDIFTSMNMPFAGEVEFGGYKKITNEDFLEKEIGMINGLLKEQDYKGKYYVTDWSNSIANRNYIQDSCHKGTFILKKVIENYQIVDGMGIWYASDLINVYYDSVNILSGSAGLLTKDGICKPSLYAFEFLNRMGKYFLDKGEDYLITKDENGDIQILLFHYKEPGAGYYMKEEDSYKPDELEWMFTSHNSKTIELSLDYLEKNHFYMVYQKIINCKSGSVLDKWVEMECSQDLRSEDILYLRNVSVPKVEVRRVWSAQGKIQLSIQMEPHEFRWISVKNQ